MIKDVVIHWIIAVCCVASVLLSIVCLFFPAFPPSLYIYRVCYDNFIIPFGIASVVVPWVLSVYFTIKVHISKKHDSFICFLFLSIFLFCIFLFMVSVFLMTSAEICYPF